MKAKSHIFSEMRGTVGGITYTANKYAPIIARQYVNPVHPNTSFQNNVKEAFSAAVLAWRLASDATRQGWNNWAASMGITGGGRQAFISSGAFVNYLYQRGKLTSAFNETVPNLDGIPLLLLGFVPYDGAVGTTGITVTVENIAAVPQKFALWYGVQVSGARNFYDGPWLPASLQVDEIDAQDAGSYTLTIPDGVEGQRLFVRLMPWVDDATPYSGQIVGTEVISFDNLQTAEA